MRLAISVPSMNTKIHVQAPPALDVTLYQHGMLPTGPTVALLGFPAHVLRTFAALTETHRPIGCRTVAEVELLRRSSAQVVGLYVWAAAIDGGTATYLRRSQGLVEIVAVCEGPFASVGGPDDIPLSFISSAWDESVRCPADVWNRAIASRVESAPSSADERSSRVGSQIRSWAAEQYGGLHAPNLDGEWDPHSTILVLDDEPSACWGVREQELWLEQVARDFPDHTLLFRAHPAFVQGPAIRGRYSTVDSRVSIARLVERLSKCVVNNSFSGFEALARGASVITYGNPFYSGLGLTEDRGLPPSVRTTPRRLGLDELANLVYLDLPRYVTAKIEPEEEGRVDLNSFFEAYARRRSDAERRKILSLPSPHQQRVRTAIAFSVGEKWRPAIERILPEYRFVYLFKRGYQETIRKLHKDDPSLCAVLWGFFQPDDFESFAESINLPVFRFEDGFLRSVGTGRDVDARGGTNYPLSLTLDGRGIYYDRRAESDVERLLKSYPFESDPWLLDRAKECIAKINLLRLTKYNTTDTVDAERVYGKKDRYRILVIGQVELDRSIQFGCSQRITNNDVIRAARRDHPEAQIIYKPHPVVLRRHVDSVSDPAEVANICEIVTDEMSLPDALVSVDHLYTITSGCGMEALLRGIKVTTFGTNFYAGWGLTDDRDPLPRRNRTLSVEALFAGFYILHTRYFDHQANRPIEIEEAIEILARDKEMQVGVEEYNRALLLEQEGDIALAQGAIAAALEKNQRYRDWFEVGTRIFLKAGDWSRAEALSISCDQQHLAGPLCRLVLSHPWHKGHGFSQKKRDLDALATRPETSALSRLAQVELAWLVGEPHHAPLRGLEKTLAKRPDDLFGPDLYLAATLALEAGNSELSEALLKQAATYATALPEPLALALLRRRTWAKEMVQRMVTEIPVVPPYPPNGSIALHTDEATGDVIATDDSHSVCWSFLARPRLCKGPCVVRQSSFYRPLDGWQELTIPDRQDPIFLLPLSIERQAARSLDAMPQLAKLASIWLRAVGYGPEQLQVPAGAS